MGVVSTGSINQENALAAYKGLLLNRSWISWVEWDNHSIYRSLISYSPYAAWITYSLSQSLFRTSNEVEQILSPARVTSIKGPYYYTASALAVLNGAKVFKDYWSGQVKDKQSAKEGMMGTVLVLVWKATPYLIIANIATTIIQVQRGDSTAYVTLAFTGITLLDLTTLKMSTNYQWYRNVVLESSVAAAAFYYSNNTNRLNIIRYSAPKIITGIVLTSQTVYQVMRKPLVNGLNLCLTKTLENLEQVPVKMQAKTRRVIIIMLAELRKDAKDLSILEMITRISTTVEEKLKGPEQTKNS
jgi:hypothetical protein